MYNGNRYIQLEGTYNVRDVGGYALQSGRQTRWKTLLRADSLNALTPAAQKQLLQYGLRHIIDLRSQYELEREPNVFASSTLVRYINIPLLPGSGSPQPDQMPSDLTTLYRQILDDAQPALLRVMTILAEDGGLPALVHCTAGKDRTGVVVALLLDLVGVSDADITADYAQSAALMAPKFTLMRQQAATAGYDMTPFEPLLLSEPVTMIETLNYLDTAYSGAAAYLRHIGMADEQIIRLQTALVY